MHSFGTFWGGLGTFWSNSCMLKSQPVKKVEVEFPKSHSINLLNWLQSSSNSSLLQLCSRNVQHYSEYNWICSVFTTTKKLTYKQIQKKILQFYQELWRVGCPPVQVFQPLRVYEIASLYFNDIDLLLIIIFFLIFFHALLKKKVTHHVANIFKGVAVDHAEAHNEQISVGVGQPWIGKIQ